MTHVDIGICDSCSRTFSYRLIHNGFNDSAFAYCDRCSCLASLSAWHKSIPAAAQFRAHGPVTPETEALLQPCQCGGTFRASASPRCPHCNHPLSAEAATSYVEANAPGTAKGWKWQRSWQGLYCVIVEGRAVSDVWASV
jgi:hypothetical protein